MAKFFGKAGQSAQTIADDKRRTFKIMALIGLGIVAVCMVLSLKLMAMKASMTIGIVGFALFALIKGLDVFLTREEKANKREVKRAERGAKGEETISATLTELPDTYSVFNDLRRVAGDIDHIVVGPTGLFVIETKAHGGRITVEGNSLLVNGHPAEKDFINQVWRNAYFIRDLLQNVLGLAVRVQPIVVFPNAFVRVRPVKGVTVINKRDLTKVILGGKGVDLPFEQIVGLLKQKMGKDV